MEIISNFEFKLNRNQVLNSLKLYDNNLDYEKINSLYESLLPILYADVKPIGIFEICNKKQDFSLNILKDYDYLVYSMVTIGEDISIEINNIFSHKEIIEGMLLDAMSTSYLFQISSELFKYIYKDCKKSGLGLSCRISSGDGNLPFSYQKNIANKLHSKTNAGIYILDNYMLFPLKSMAYIYGADNDMELNSIDHDCTKCLNKNSCVMNISKAR